MATMNLRFRVNQPLPQHKSMTRIPLVRLMRCLQIFVQLPSPKV